MSRVSWLMVAVILVAQIAEAAPPDSGPLPDADFLEFLGSWQTGDDRWVDPFYVDEVSDLETKGQQLPSQRPKYLNPTQQRQVEANKESSQTGTDSTVPRRDVKP